MDHLGVGEDVLREYLTHGDSELLANVIYMTCRLSRTSWVPISAPPSLSKFDIRDTLPEVQHEFCSV